MTHTIYELPASRFRAAWPLFEPIPVDRAYIHAVFEELDPGRCFVDAMDTPTAALLCRTYDYYLAGRPEPALMTFIGDAPAESGVFASMYGYVPMGDRAMTESGFVTIDATLQHELAAHHVEAFDVWERRSFTFDPERAPTATRWRDQVPAGVQVVPIDAALAERIDRELNEVIGLVWGGYDRFAARGFGACAIAGESIASTCFTLGLSRHYADLGVATAPGFRRRGLAALTARACLAGSLERGLTPTWDCDRINAPSAALALSLGFVEGPTFTELAFPERATPRLSAGLWRPEPAADGVIAWRRTRGD